MNPFAKAGQPVSTPHPNAEYHDPAAEIALPEPLPVALRFEAGKGSKEHATHGSIEEVLKTAGFTDNEVLAIHYGNWLRDYSQLLDPKIVRATSMPKNFPDVLSREALTKIVDILAVREFIDLMKIDRSGFMVTEERLGVYRPSEHIDNPKAVNPSPADPRDRDADFELWVLPGNPLLEVDPDTSMKRYIQRSVDVMSSKLESAMQAGIQSTDALRELGAGLHILEDFFAHSNFVELSLIKAGYADVLPWTSKAPCKHGIPLVTGMFGGSDVIASLAAPLGEILFSNEQKPFEATKAGERSERDQIILILLSEHPNTTLLEAYETFLAARDKWASLPFASQVEQFYHFINLPGRLFGSAMGTVMQGLATWLGNSVDDVQTFLGDDPNTSGSTDPSHSQLAKDHKEHPLHLLAAELARKAVLDVGQAVLSMEHGKEGAEHPAIVAARYFTHPMDSEWQDEIVKRWAMENRDSVQRATRRSDLLDGQKRLQESAQNAFKTFKSDSSDFLDTFFEKASDLQRYLNRILGK
ncbi:hypothetical protein J3P77_19025 [Pseudomonas sp. R1-18]|uniref:HET-C-related protein n=1 Tax=Pseudomonas sp. R1-18 TaxID=1632772 RepID=UPI003DA7F58D